MERFYQFVRNNSQLEKDVEMYNAYLFQSNVDGNMLFGDSFYLETWVACDYFAKLYNEWTAGNPTSTTLPEDLQGQFIQKANKAIPLISKSASLEARFQSIRLNEEPSNEEEWRLMELLSVADSQPAPEDCSLFIEDAQREEVEDLFEPEYPWPYGCTLQGLERALYAIKISRFLLKWYQIFASDDARMERARSLLQVRRQDIVQELLDVFNKFRPDCRRKIFIVKCVEESLNEFAKYKYKRFAIPLTLSQVQYQAVCAAFEQDFVDLGTLTAFKRHAEMIFELWDPAVYFSPYTSVVQVSMSGKTSMLMKLGSGEDFFVVYCCFRNFTSSGYPHRSRIANTLQTRSSIGGFVRFFVVCLQYLTDNPSLTPTQFITVLREAPDVVWEDIDRRMAGLQSTKTYTVIEERNAESLIWEAHEEYRKAHNRNEQGPPAVAFAFDEVHELLEVPYGESPESAPFYKLQRAMRFFPAQKRCRMLGVFVDTMPCVSKFSPASSRDQTCRVGNSSRKLFPPFWYVVGVDANLNGQALPQTVEASIESAQNYGLPMWGAMTKAGVPDHDCIYLAMSKLVGGLEFQVWVKALTRKCTLELEEAIAILGMRICIEVSPQSQVASNLVALYMRVCQHISEDRHALVTSYISDPTLALAAAEIMNHANMKLEYLLDPITHAMKSGVVKEGYQGELAARILLVLAWDHGRKAACGASTVVFDGVLTLEQYLQSLLAKNVFETFRAKLLAKNKQKLLGKKLRCLQFISITYKPKKRDLMEFFRRGVVIACTRNQEGVDLLLPLFDGEMNVDFDEEQFSSVLIQVNMLTRRGKDSDYPVSETINLSPVAAGFEFTRGDYLAIYMSMNSATPHSESQNFEICCPLPGANFHQLSISLFGISPSVYGCVDKDDAAKLTLLAKAWPDPLDLTSTKESKEIVKLMAPLMYSYDSNESDAEEEVLVLTLLDSEKPQNQT